MCQATFCEALIFKERSTLARRADDSHRHHKGDTLRRAGQLYASTELAQVSEPLRKIEDGRYRP
jgi:hypothetical protein